MQVHNISVAPAQSGSWQVCNGSPPSAIRVFKLISHPVAFGCALVFSRLTDLYISGPDGSAMLQS